MPDIAKYAVSGQTQKKTVISENVTARLPNRGPRNASRCGERRSRGARSRHTNRICLPRRANDDDVAIPTLLFAHATDISDREIPTGINPLGMTPLLQRKQCGNLNLYYFKEDFI